MNVKFSTLLLLFLVIIPISCKTLSKRNSSDLESKAPSFGKINDCPCQDEEWVAKLVDEVNEYYRKIPVDQRPKEGWQRRNYNAGGKERRKIKERDGIEVVRSFSGLSPLFYAQGNNAGFDNSELLRKERILEKWAPNIVMFKDDFKPVSIKRIFEVATVLIYSNKEVNVKRGESIPGKLEEDKKRGKYLRYIIVPKEYSELKRKRARYRLYDEGIIDRGNKKEISKAIEIYNKEFENAKLIYQEAKKTGELEGLIDPTKLTPREIQQVLSHLEDFSVKTGEPRYTYLSFDEDETMSSKKDLATEAHIYGVVKEFTMDDGYEYASLQYHLSQLNSFLPGKLLYWHQGDTEKGQIVLRRPIGASDDDYKFYGAECSQHYYATTYFASIFPNKMLKGDERFNLYVSEGSHASQYLPGYHLSAKSQWGPYAEHKFLGKKLYRGKFTDPLKLKTLFYLLQGKLIDRAPSLEGQKDNEIILEPISFYKLENGKLKDEELNSKYVLHSNYPDNAWIWMGFSEADRNFHLGAKSIRPGGSGPRLPKYFADIPARSLFCNPIDHYYYYFRPTMKTAKVAAKLNNAHDTVDLAISYGKLYRLLYEALDTYEERKNAEIVLTASDAIDYQAEIAMKYVKKITGFRKYFLPKGKRQQRIDEEIKRVDDIVKKLQNYINPGNAQTNEGWLKLLNEIKR